MQDAQVGVWDVELVAFLSQSNIISSL
jgi:hypothetical protein